MSVLPTSAETAIDLNGIFSPIDFQSTRSIVVAVSGGSDSLALLYLLLEYRGLRQPFPNIIVVTVDHGLRAESRDEANFVGELCQKAGVAHRILQWEGQKPRTGLSAKARESRYKLLCEAARDAGAEIILTGHTLDDQFETVLMRSARSVVDGSERGQAGMAPATLLERQVWLFRPLLNLRREALREYLRVRGVAWRDDPSNDNSKYERVRIRKSIDGNDLAQLHRDINEKALKRRQLNAEVGAALPDCVTIFKGIKAEIDREKWFQHKAEVQQLAIGVVLAAMGGQSFLPSTAHCDKALEFARQTLNYAKLALSRCIIETRPEKILIYREMRSVPRISVEPNTSVVWDGRYRVTNMRTASAIIDACGKQGVERLKKTSPEVHSPSALSSPAIHFDGHLHYIAFDDHGKLPEGLLIERHIGLFDNFLVGYDELLAQSVAKLFILPAYKHYSVNQIEKNWAEVER